MSNTERTPIFNEEIQTIKIEDFETVAKSQSKNPFSDELGPQASISKRYNAPNTTSKFKFIEASVHGRSIDEILTSGKVLWVENSDVINLVPAI